MRKFTQVALSTGLFAAAAGLVWAAQPGEAGFVPRAYVSTSFGGTVEQQRKGNFFYGMRLDRDTTFDGRYLNLPPVVQLAFDRYGMTAASLYGMPFAQRKLALNQTEGDAPAAEGTHYTFVDWTLLAVGAVGIGYAISEVVDQKDTKDPASTSGGGAAAGGGSSTGGGSTGGGSTGGGSTGGGSSTGGATGSGFAELRGTTPLDSQYNSSEAIKEYQQWLDGGTGQMGDLQQH